MFLEIVDLEPKELKRLEMMFGKRLSAFRNIHYQTCVEEILCALENNLIEEELNEFMTDEMFGTNVSELAQELYDSSICQWDDLYEKADSIVYKFINEMYGE